MEALREDAQRDLSVLAPRPAAPRDRLLPALADEAWQRFVRGMTLSAIAHELQLDRETVSRYVKAIQRDQARALRAKREAALALSVARFREIARVAWERADQDSVSALSVALAAEREVARLLGLYHLEVAPPAAPEISITIIPRKDGDRVDGVMCRLANGRDVVDATPLEGGSIIRRRGE